jgi:hypothetical protein
VKVRWSDSDHLDRDRDLDLDLDLDLDRDRDPGRSCATYAAIACETEGDRDDTGVLATPQGGQVPPVRGLQLTMFGFAQQSWPGMLQVNMHFMQFASTQLPLQGTLPQQTLAFGGG